MGTLLLLAIFVIYLVLGILYESFIHPLTILSGLPAAGFGALLTIIADFIGLIGGFIVANLKFDIRFSQYFTPAWQILEYNDVVQGLLKPFMFAMIIALVGCFYGMRTTGGTEGVGRSVTKAVVLSSIWIFVTTFFIGQIFINLA